MIIDNTEQIKKLINKCVDDEFYFLQIVHREKDGNMPYKSDKNINWQIIKTYYISSPEELDDNIEEIKTICQMFNARAYINLNKKSWKQISLMILKILTDIIEKVNNNLNVYDDMDNLIYSACYQTGACDNKSTWVIDADNKSIIELNIIKNAIEQCDIHNKNKIIATIKTLNGYHIITKPFDRLKFYNLYNKHIDILNNRSTLLYFKKL